MGSCHLIEDSREGRMGWSSAGPSKGSEPTLVVARRRKRRISLPLSRSQIRQTSGLGPLSPMQHPARQPQRLQCNKHPTSSRRPAHLPRDAAVHSSNAVACPARWSRQRSGAHVRNNWRLQNWPSDVSGQPAPCFVRPAVCRQDTVGHDARRAGP
jgi:hypothetical protein